MTSGLGTLVKSRFRAPSPPPAAGSLGAARSVLPELLHGTFPIALVAAWALVIRHIRLSDMTDLGLVSVLPRDVFLLLFALTASFCLSLARRPLRSLVPLIHVLALIVLLYGITTFIEPEPRIPTVYLHSGVMNYIAGHGSVNTEIDAYFNWPGFFALGALITKAAGFRTALVFAAWGPIVFNLLFLPPLIVIFRWASADPRVTWLGLWTFYSTNWVAQDHIAPQAMGYLLSLSILAFLLTWFTPRPTVRVALSMRRRLGGFISVRRLQALVSGRRVLIREAPTGTLITVLVLIVVIYGAIVSGHQLTPVPVLVTVTGLILFARLQTRGLPVLMAVLLVAWLSYMTFSYLEGHLQDVIGALGNVTQNVGQSTAGRVVGSPDHQLIVDLRVAASAGIWCLAIAGVGRRLRAGRADAAMAVIAASPFLLPALQPYGGEILLRVFLFALPGVSFFIASLAFPAVSSGRGWLTIATCLIVGCLFLGLFQYTRYGNERLDSMTLGDLAVVQAFYRLAPKGSTVYALDGNVPWKYQDYAAYKYRLVSELRAWRTPSPNARLLATELQRSVGSYGGYVIVTRSTEIEAEVFYGAPAVGQDLVAVLQSAPGVRELYRGVGGELFYVRGHRGHAG